MFVGILEIGLGQSDANRQVSISINTIALVPEGVCRSPLFVQAIRLRQAGGITGTPDNSQKRKRQGGLQTRRWLQFAAS
jgi:hypothetical protein